VIAMNALRSSDSRTVEWGRGRAHTGPDPSGFPYRVSPELGRETSGASVCTRPPTAEILLASPIVVAKHNG
jgi:hypothetical protein